jgi:phospholipid/cholesterol/gamma-HCH transport system substrate-binding protein
MAGDSLATVVKRRLLGVVFLVVVASLVALSIAIYNKAFTDTVDVKMLADHTGNQLIIDSDVKERGIIVGSVKKVDSKGSGAIVTLALNPSRVKDIPSNVRAQILPKTLFGEQYVSLVTPIDTVAGNAAVHPIKANDTIPQDRSKGALETQRVLGDILPLLNAVDPADLNATLTGLAEALHNRGNKLGQTLVNFDSYLKQLNPHTKQLADDLTKLGQVSLEYNDLAPDIFSTLKNLQTSAKTVVERRSALDSLFVQGTDASNVLRGFLADNEQRIIAVTGQTTKIYALLNEYSPEFSCLFSGVNHLYDLASQAIYENRIHLAVTINANNLGAYRPGQEPKPLTGIGPNCFGLPDNPQPTDANGRFQFPDKFKCLNDGAALTRQGATGGCGSGTSTSSSKNQAIGSPEEDALVNTIVAGDMGTTPNKVPGAATLLAGPLLRGQQVVVK